MTAVPPSGDLIAKDSKPVATKTESAALFRPEVVSAQQSHWLGTVLLAPRITHRLFAGFAIVAVAGLLSLLIFGDYARKARLQGWLVPESGLVRVFAPQSGVVAQLNVKEGDAVREGAALIHISTESESVAYGATRQVVVRQLLSRIDSIMTEREQQEQLSGYQLAEMQGRLVTIEDELAQIGEEISLQRERLALSESDVDRQIELRERGMIRAEAVLQAQQDKLDQALRLQALERDRIVIDRTRLQLQSDIQQLPLRNEALLAAFDRQGATLEQELAEAESQRETVLLAPQDGTVTGVYATEGSNVGVNAPLLSIVPAGSKLEAELFSPSSAIGFVRPGQQVLLRYDAFPYQKFGTHDGVISEVSQSGVSPTDLPQQLFWISTLNTAAEPLYRITVTPGSQVIGAYGETVALQPGMRLEADVVIERRRLIEWVLDPLYTLTGR